MTDVGGVPVVYTGGNGFGEGGCGISTLLIFALLAGGGFGGWGRGDCHGVYDCAEMSHIDHQFSQLQDDVQNSEVLTQMQIENLGVNQFQQAIFKEICDTNRNVDSKFCDTQFQIAEAKYDNAIIAKNAEINQLKCCCETKEAIAASTSAILQKMDAREIQDLRDRLNDVQLGLSQCKQNGYLINELRPYPAPAFAVNNPAQQVFPPTPAVPAAAVYGAYGLGGGCCCG